MQDLNDKVTGNSLTASEWNQVPSELQNVIEALGIVLSSGDLNQLGKAIAGYVANGSFYADSGVADAYVLAPIGTKQAPTAYTDGMVINFFPGNPNSGASTVNVAGLGVKNLRGPTGNALSDGDITALHVMRFRYNVSAGHFRLDGAEPIMRTAPYSVTHNMASDADYTLTGAQALNGRLIITDSGVLLTTARNIIMPLAKRRYYVQNSTAQALTFKTAAGTGAGVAAGGKGIVYCDGTNVVDLLPPQVTAARQNVAVRQTTLAGGTDANGYANYLSAGTGLAVNLAATATPVVDAFANGYDANGEVNYVKRTATDVAGAWSGLGASSLWLLYKDYNPATDTITYGAELGIHGRGWQSEYVRTPIDSTPTMTSNTAPYGVASASAINSATYDAWKAFNNTDALESDAWLTSAGVGTGWLRYQFPAAVVIKRYSLRPRNIAGRADPNDWTFEGSNNGTDWTVLDTRTGQGAGWGQTQVKTYDVTNSTGYLYYRINVTSSANNGGTTLGIGEFELFAVQSFFSIPDMKMYEWEGGSTWTEKIRLFVGECVTGASTVTSVTTYALRGESYVDTTDAAGNTTTNFTNRIGTVPQRTKLWLINIIAEYGWLPNEVATDPGDHHDGSTDRRVFIDFKGSTGRIRTGAAPPAVFRRDTDAAVGPTATNWKLRVLMSRGW